MQFSGHAHRNDDYYTATERHVEKITRFYFKLTLGASIFYGMIPFLIVFYDLINGQYSFSSWSLHYNNVWLPFELNSVKRFIGVNIVQSASCWLGTTVLITINSLYFGIICYLRAFCQDVKFYFDEMNQLDRNRDKQLFFSLLCDTIRFHMKITE